MTPKETRAKEMVKSYALASAGAGCVPVPLFDIAAIAILQVKMLYDLAGVYEQQFRPERGRAIVSALVGSVLSTSVGYGLAGGLIPRLPIIGPLVGLATVPALGSAATYAIGKVFIQHFESGGTLLDFNPAAVRAHFEREFEQARSV
jgi:uncharacterized protein (DUF697 family)